MEAIFSQVSEIGDKINDHHFLVMKNFANDLEKGLADQENNIRRLEWLAGQTNEFSLVLSNTFSSSSLYNVSRSDKLAEALYFDNRTYEVQKEEDLSTRRVFTVFSGMPTICATSSTDFSW